MFGAFLFFLAAYLLGLSILKFLKIDIGKIEKVASVVIGVVSLSLILYFGAFIFGLTQGFIYTASIVLLVLSVLINFKQQKSGLTHFLSKVNSRNFLILIPGILRKSVINSREIFIWTFLFLLVVWLFGRALFFDPQGNLVAGDRLVWTDWPVHIGLSASFAWGDNFPAQNPTFAQEPLRYPFFADFVTGVLWKLGMPLPTALALPAIVLIMAFFWIFVEFTREILEEIKLLKGLKSLKFLPLILSLFWGGIGFVYYFKDILASGGFATGNFYPVREYTFWQEKGLWFFTFLYSEILPQRAFIFGLPLFFLILYLVKTGIENFRSSGKQQLVLAGILAGLMPYFHTHTYLSLLFLVVTVAIVTGMFIVISSGALAKSRNLIRHSSDKRFLDYARDDARWKQYLQSLFLFFLPFGVLSLLQLPLFLGQFGGWPFEFGWMKGSENFFWFWLKNTGLFIPLALWGLWKGKLSGFGKLVMGASWILFILPNLFHFAPWGYDNLKILTYWYLLGSIAVVAGLVRIRKIRVIGGIGVVLLFLSLTLSGLIEVGRIFDTPKSQITLWSKQDQELAETIKTKTEPEAVFLAAAIHDHPVVSLAGRKIVIGYPGNSWSWGLKNWDSRFKDVKTMFRGGETARELWKKYGIDYIIISDRERYFDAQIDEEFMQQNGELVIEQGTTKIYKIE